MPAESPHELAENRRQLREIVDRAESLAAKLTPESLNQPGPNGGWSAGECLDHLNITHRLYLEKIPAVLERAHARGLTGAREPKRGFLGRKIIQSLEPPVKTRFKTPQKFRPNTHRKFELEALIQEFRELRERLDDVFEESADLDLWRVKMSSPALPILRLSLGEMFQILLAHDRRHLLQAERAAGV